jgi:O-antigen/teichoic acid export membrane protein
LARLLTPADFGLVAIANVVIGFIAMFTRFGLGQALVQRKELTQAHIRVGFTIVLLSAFLLTILLIIAAPLFSTFFQNDSVTSVLQVLSLSFLLTNLGTVAEFLLIRDLAFDRLFRATVLTYTVGYALVGIGMAIMDYGVWALVGATLGTDLVKSLILIRLRPHAKRPLLAKKEFKDLIHFGGGITLANLANYMANTADYFIIGRWLGAAPLGIYQQAFNVMLLPARYLGDVLDRVLFASASHVQDQAQSLKRGYRKSMSIINLILMPTSVMMLILAPEIVLTMFGSQWEEAILPLQILLVGVAFRTTSRISDAFVHAMGSVYESAVRKYVYVLLVIIGSWAAMPWGIPGVAVAVTLAVTMNYLLIVQLCLRITETSWREHLQDLAPGFFLSLVVLTSAFLSSEILRNIAFVELIVLAGSLLIVFIVTSLFLWLLPHALGPSGTWLSQEMSKALFKFGGGIKRRALLSLGLEK